ncbi:MAG: DUF362 domain-containing protein [Candidatus Omnitrophica bacterium]|nr:DUF362 domain-containing protein [Candidatus Omnitrophota bacterium]
MRTKVYYIPTDTKPTKEKALFSVSNVLNHRMFHLLRIYYGNQIVGIKPCRKDNYNYKKLNFVSQISNILREQGVDVLLCDTTDRFIKRNSTAISAIEIAKCGGLDSSFPPLVILDGLKGNHSFIPDQENGEKTYLSGEIQNLDGLIIISEPDTHELCGITGALFNLGEGLASKQGKISQYSMSKPRVNVTKCYTCRRCLHACPVQAIYMTEKHIDIDKKKCINCGKCVEIARFGGITYSWDATSEHFSSSILRYAKRAYKILNYRTIFINFISDINNGKNDYSGILISRDPVAVDKASVDLLSKQTNDLSMDNKTIANLFDKAVSTGVGSLDYELVTVAY